MRKIVVFITSIFLILTSTITNAATVGGWVLSNPKPQGASTLYDASKTVLDKTRKSTVLITPNSSQVAKVLRGGVAGYALSVAVEQLLGAVDWVLDPVNNQINYLFKQVSGSSCPSDISCPSSPYLYWVGGNTKYSDAVTACSNAESILTHPEWKGWTGKVEADGTYCRFYDNEGGDRGTQIISKTVNSAYDPSAPNNENSISLETVAQRVITNAGYNDSNAQAATSAAAENMATDAEADEDAAQPIKEQLENNAVDVGSGDPNDPDDEAEKNCKQAKHLNHKQIGNLVCNSK